MNFGFVRLRKGNQFKIVLSQNILLVQTTFSKIQAHLQEHLCFTAMLKKYTLQHHLNYSKIPTFACYKKKKNTKKKNPHKLTSACIIVSMLPLTRSTHAK